MMSDALVLIQCFVHKNKIDSSLENTWEKTAKLQ